MEEKLDISPRTVVRYHQRLGHNSEAARRKSPIISSGKFWPLKWWRTCYYFETLVFSCESRFALLSDISQVWYCRQWDQEFKWKRFQPSMKHDNYYVIAWQVIWCNGQPDLVRCEGSISQTNIGPYCWESNKNDYKCFFIYGWCRSLKYGLHDPRFSGREWH